MAVHFVGHTLSATSALGDEGALGGAATQLQLVDAKATLGPSGQLQRAAPAGPQPAHWESDWH